MDPSTTLVTFHFETHPSIQSVHLIGSWDNFTSYYPMDRDSRRGKGQWKGCHTFRDIISDGAAKARHGALRMGHTYYYYYEVDGSTETFDPKMPTTNACPYLPGQTLNTLVVPSQKSLRQRSASLNSMRITDYQAVDPQAKFITPQPEPAPPVDAAAMRKASAPGHLRNCASSRSLSPTPAWKRLFTHRSHNDDRGRSRDRDDMSVASAPVYDTITRSPASSRPASRNRSMSPESLRRFLSDDTPSRPASNLSERPALIIPEDIVEENEDDDNFALSAVSESAPFATSLSPPPFRRSESSDATPLTLKNLSSLTLSTERPPSRKPALTVDMTAAEDTPALETISHPHSSTLTSATSSILASPQSATGPDDEALTFYDDSNDDDDFNSPKEPEVSMFQHSLRSRFTGYHLPRQSEEAPVKFESQPAPEFVTAGAPDFSVTRSTFLATPIDTGVDDFASELGWMVHTIGTKEK